MINYAFPRKNLYLYINQVTWRELYGEGASEPYKSHCPVVLPISSRSKYTLLSPYFATTVPLLRIQPNEN